MPSLSSVLAFRTRPTTLLIVLTYVTIFISVFITDKLPKVPGAHGVDVNKAYNDLHHIAARPHPYNSHSNDVVRSYILDRLQKVASEQAHVHVIDDLTSNASWAFGSQGVYFEGTNILVKIDGTDPDYGNTGGVLFSAHYDSVSTAPGATDDGMGVATLMQLVEYFAEKRTKRTAVFNINNGEEDGLSGAHAFLEHPWSNISETFLNLEGAAAGGRPMLFRATSTAPILSFLASNVPHPHANVLSQDAFARGLIRSGTDYSVYVDGPAMEGLDLAFYKGRSKYHTKYDAIANTDGQERSLFSMMEAAKGAGVALLNKDETHNKKGNGAAVYFDLFAAALVVFPLSALYIFNIVLLIVGPIILILFVAFDHVLHDAPQRHPQNGRLHEEDNLAVRIWDSLKRFQWLLILWRSAKFWVALVVLLGFQVLLVFTFLKLNSFIIYSSPYLVLLSAFTLAYATFTFTLRLPIGDLTLPEQQKQTMLTQTYVFTWLLLVLSTIAIGRLQMGGLYLISIWNALVFLACVIGCAEEMFGARGTPGHEGVDRIIRPVRSGEEPDEVHVDDATEETPLMGHRVSPRVEDKEESGAIGWWIVQLLLVVPTPLILVSHIGMLMMDALPQTLADGSSAATVYATASLISVLLVVPLAPFSLKIHRGIGFLLSFVFAVSVVYCLLAFPFDQASPLKVFFQQRIVFQDSITSANAFLGLNTTIELQSPAVVTSLSGSKNYLAKILSKLPSSQGKSIIVVDNSLRQGTSTFSWTSQLIPSPGGRKLDDPIVPHGNISFNAGEWLRASAEKTGDGSARIFLRGRNTRSCRVYIEKRRITRWFVRGSDGRVQERFGVSKDGVSELRLWSRTWDREFVVDIEWEGGSAEGAGLGGAVACEWSEYESANVDNGSMRNAEDVAKIPAYEEVLSFLPEWAVASKAGDGLVEVVKGFVL